MNRFVDQVAIVTGAGQGIGLAICQQLVAEGAKVILNDVDEKLANDSATRLCELGICKAMAGDASDTSFIQSMVDSTVEHFSKVDIIIANAGITVFGNFFDYSPENFDKIIRLNLRGSFFLAQAGARQMRKQGEGGRIIFMSSVTGHQAHQNLEAYGMTKAALEMLAKSLVIELSPFKICINAIAPGATLSERNVNDPEYNETWSRLTPLKKPATPEDIAYATLFLASAQASHITGQTLIVDGGWSSVSPSPY